MTEYTGGILSRAGVITSAPASGYHWARRVGRRRRPPFAAIAGSPSLPGPWLHCWPGRGASLGKSQSALLGVWFCQL